MSTGTGTRSDTGPGSGTDAFDAARSALNFRTLALAAGLVLTATYVFVLWDVTQVVGGSAVLWPTVATMVVAATVLARSIRPRVAAGLAVSVAVLGYGYYLVVTPVDLAFVLAQLDKILADAVALLTGLSVLRLVRADVWALAFAPAPVFLSWYFLVRRGYVLGVTVGGTALAVLVMTGDAGDVITLAGTLAGILAVGFGELDRRNGTILQADALAVLVALLAVTSLTLSLVPGGAADPLTPGFASQSSSTIEGSLTGSTDRVSIVGAIDLSPAVRFTVTADEGRYWRTGTYDRFAGGSWVRTGQASRYEGRLSTPPGPRRTVVQTYRAEAESVTMPAAAEPVAVVGDAAAYTQVTDQGNLRPDSSFIEGDRYRIESAVLTATPEMLRNAGTDYERIDRERYTQLPESTSQAFRDRTAAVVANGSTAYEKAVRIETYLESTKSYSLDVERPDGNIANRFLLEGSEGYCVYFATTMVAMLRAEGVPARMAVGYTPGQQIGENEYVVRGLDSHAWVEVYFPDYGWVQFDPTPASPRQDAEFDRIEDARESEFGAPVDTEDSEDVPVTTTTTTVTNESRINATPGDRTTTPPFGAISGGPNGSFQNGTPIVDTEGLPAERDDGGGSLPTPSREQTALGLVVLVGAVAGAHRVGYTDRVYRSARMHFQGRRSTPEADAERAYERLELLLMKRYRPRRPNETPRQYIDALSTVGLDVRAREVANAYERARFAGEVSRARADDAVDAVDELVRESTPVVGRVFR